MPPTSLDIRGVHIPSTTPFDPVTGDVDLVGLRSNLRRWFETPIRGVVLGGSTGEAVLLDETERRAVWDAAAETIPDGRLMIAGTGAESTRATLRLCASAAAAGADAVLVQPPAFYKGAMTPSVLARHYRRVADECPVPVIVYQVPLRLNTLEFATGLVSELSIHPNVIGIKDSRGSLDLVAELVDACHPDFQVLVGSGAILYGALEAGAVGGILGVANLAPAASAGVTTAVAEGRSADAGRLQERIGPLHNAVIAKLGVSGVKVGLELLGMHGGDPRPPLGPLDDDGRHAVQEALRAAGLLRTTAPA